MMGVVAASLRRFRDARSDVRSVPRISSLPPEPDGPPRLLAIVPTEPIHQSLEAFLRTSGYYVQFAPSITDFWTSIAKAPPDLVLIPEGSAELSAVEVCGELRMRRSTRHLPLVVLMPEGDNEDVVVRALRAGADDCVSLQRPAEMGARIAVQLRNNRYRQMLRQVRSERDVLKVAASVDPLTRIPNRRALDREMAQLVERKTPFGLLFLDIDRFKSINDQLGHEVGDIVLARIAKYIQNGIRSNDFCGRYGGEEFIIVVHGADELLTSKVAERHRRAISKLTFEPKGPKHPVTVSVGVAAYDPEQNDDVNVVVRRADRALYRAKNTGRNRVVVASELPVTHSLLPPQPVEGRFDSPAATRIRGLCAGGGGAVACSGHGTGSASGVARDRDPSAAAGKRSQYGLAGVFGVGRP